MNCPTGRVPYPSAHAAHSATQRMRQNKARSDSALAHKASRAGAPRLPTYTHRCPECGQFHLGKAPERKKA